ncbi:DMT family transporter [Hwanghaeella sp.]|uniref:DMT family transporter n=1 Tax=Hwanghaeella sp. TaxID=2605943 RepID=UPI003CCBC702
MAVVANAFSNIAFKHAVTAQPIDKGITGFLRLALEPWMWLGVTLAMVLLGCYLYALKGIPLSVAYPAVTGLAMVGVALGGALALGESFTLFKATAILFIIIGVVMLRFSN